MSDAPKLLLAMLSSVLAWATLGVSACSLGDPYETGPPDTEGTGICHGGWDAFVAAFNP